MKEGRDGLNDKRRRKKRRRMKKRNAFLLCVACSFFYRRRKFGRQRYLSEIYPPSQCRSLRCMYTPGIERNVKTPFFYAHVSVFLLLLLCFPFLMIFVMSLSFLICLQISFLIAFFLSFFSSFQPKWMAQGKIFLKSILSLLYSQGVLADAGNKPQDERKKERTKNGKKKEAS